MRWRSLLLERGGLLGLVTLALYATLAPAHVVDGDNAEFSTLAATGGAAHPSGYPLYIMYLRAMSWLPAHGPAHAAALATAVLAAASIVVVHAACRAWGARPLAATIAAALLAGAPPLMRIGMRAEVFALNDLVVACVLWLAAVGGPLRGRRRALALGLVAGLGVANHLTCTLVLPIGILGMIRAAREDRAVPVLAVALGGLAVGLAPYAYLFVAPDTPMSWGTVRSADDLLAFVTRRYYGGAGAFAASGDAVPVGAQLAALAGTLARSWLWAPLAVGLATLGWRVARADHTPGAETRVAWAALAVSWLAAGPLLVTRFNIEPVGIGRYVCERFYVLPVLLLAIPVAVGLTSLGARLPAIRLGERTLCAIVATVGLLGVAGASLPRLARVHTPVVENYARNVLGSLPPNAVLFAGQDYELASLGYLQAALGERTDVVVVAWQLASVPWYAERMRRRGVPIPAAGRLDPVAVIEALLAQGRPVFVERTRSPVTLAAAAALPVYVHGTAMRVLPRGVAPPPLDEVIATNEALFARFAIGDERPGPDDEYATEIHRRYAVTWEMLAHKLERAGRAGDAARMMAIAKDLGPR